MRDRQLAAWCIRHVSVTSAWRDVHGCGRPLGTVYKAVACECTESTVQSVEEFRRIAATGQTWLRVYVVMRIYLSGLCAAGVNRFSDIFTSFYARQWYDVTIDVTHASLTVKDRL